MVAKWRRRERIIKVEHYGGVRVKERDDKRIIFISIKDPNGTRRVIYAVDLLELREKEKKNSSGTS